MGSGHKMNSYFSQKRPSDSVSPQKPTFSPIRHEKKIKKGSVMGEAYRKLNIVNAGRKKTVNSDLDFKPVERRISQGKVN